ncbi:MAG: DUF429 domain-containing protein [Terracidiphilus sp.]|jgi:hypothetical protein
MHNWIMCTYVGLDPGGIGGFGWAILSGETLPLKLVGRGIADHAQGSYEAAVQCAGNAKINAVGIDAPLFWIPDGDRRADKTVRRAITHLGAHGGTVGAVNALRGACLIQGIIAAMICQRRLPKGLSITEAHPKALLWLVGKATPAHRPGDVALIDLSEYIVGDKVQGANDHERDASLAAFTAFAMESQLSGWRDLYALEIGAITPLDPPPGYWMPLNPSPDPNSKQS